MPILEVLVSKISLKSEREGVWGGGGGKVVPKGKTHNREVNVLYVLLGYIISEREPHTNPFYNLMG